MTVQRFVWSRQVGRGALIGAGALGGFIYDGHRKGNIDNFHRAGEDRPLSQSWLSRRIRNREEFFGIRLFHRQGPAGIPSSMRCS